MLFFFPVVTGSTDGIGKEYARQLAEKGVNIILISRNPEKLKKVEKEISKCILKFCWLGVYRNGHDQTKGLLSWQLFCENLYLYQEALFTYVI